MIMKNTITIILLLLFTGLVNTAFAGIKKPWPKIYDVVVRASVTIEGINIDYFYKVTNSTKNIYWKTSIPFGVRGQCIGTVVFSAIKS